MDPIKEQLFLNQQKILKSHGIDSELSRNKEMLEVYNSIDKVSKNDTNILLIGETGVGKELLAKLIHFESLRCKQNFVAVNCAAIPESIIESELFGYAKGAFTGAYNDKIGKFELANNGTLFLDEISSISHNIQTKLLRVLQEREIEKIGSNKSIKINIRLISATNENLKDKIEKNLFRSDLFYRINTFPVIIPPLRERKEDILILSNYFINKFCRKVNKSISGLSDISKKVLLNYLWPGNVRELENIIERAVILEESNTIEIESLPNDIVTEFLAKKKYNVDYNNSYKDLKKIVIANFESDYFTNLYNLYKGNTKKISSHTNMSLRNTQLKLKKLKIK